MRKRVDIKPKNPSITVTKIYIPIRPTKKTLEVLEDEEDQE